jgi:hypothetical protein
MSKPRRPAEPRSSQTPTRGKVWLVGEHCTSGEHKFYLADLPAEAALETFAVTIKARWCASLERVVACCPHCCAQLRPAPSRKVLR